MDKDNINDMQVFPANMKQKVVKVSKPQSSLWKIFSALIYLVQQLRESVQLHSCLVGTQDPKAGTPLLSKPILASLLLGNSLSNVGQATLILLACYLADEERPTAKTRSSEVTPTPTNILTLSQSLKAHQQLSKSTLHMPTVRKWFNSQLHIICMLVTEFSQGQKGEHFIYEGTIYIHYILSYYHSRKNNHIPI